MQNSGENLKATDNHVYVMPYKMVKSMDDMRNWENSEAYYEYLGFIYTLNDAVKGKTNEEGSAFASNEIYRVCNLLDVIDIWIGDIPPIKQEEENDSLEASNPAFREWYSRVRDAAIDLLQEVLPEASYRAVPEIMVYLIEGFGNSTKIDYGPGHELSFLMFLCTLFKIGFLKASDAPAAVCKVFARYLEIVRKLQRTYCMKPIDSYGVWTLDDYQFVSFIWGSSQLIGQFNGVCIEEGGSLIRNQQFDPSSFLKDHVVRTNSSQYMFFDCIEYINTIKKGSFAEHSNQLWSVSGVSSWSKVNSGLIRMYRMDILSKFSLMQYLYFGSIFTLNPVEQGASIRRPKISITTIHKPSTNVEFTGLLGTRKTVLSSDFRRESRDETKLEQKPSGDVIRLSRDEKLGFKTSVEIKTNFDSLLGSDIKLQSENGDERNEVKTSVENASGEKRDTQTSEAIEFLDDEKRERNTSSEDEEENGATKISAEFLDDEKKEKKRSSAELDKDEKRSTSSSVEFLDVDKKPDEASSGLVSGDEKRRTKTSVEFADYVKKEKKASSDLVNKDEKRPTKTSVEFVENGKKEAKRSSSESAKAGKKEKREIRTYVEVTEDTKKEARVSEVVIESKKEVHRTSGVSKSATPMKSSPESR